MTKPKIKVCGVTDAAFAREAARRQVDYLGMIFACSSPRRVTLDVARAIVAATPIVRHVGVFTDHTRDDIRRLAHAAALDVVQLHSTAYTDEDVSALRAEGFEVWRLEGPADATLLDGRDGARTGGTGMLADWSRVQALKALGRRVVLAGGLGPHNIREAAATGADILDVNSTLETSPGVKSLERLDALLAKRLPRAPGGASSKHIA